MMPAFFYFNNYIKFFSKYEGVVKLPPPPSEEFTFRKPSLRINFLFQTEVSFEKPYALNLGSSSLNYRDLYDSILKLCEIFGLI